MAQANRTRKLEATFARRRRFLVIVALCVWGAIWARAVHLQVINRTTLSDVSERQSDRKVRLVAPRGEIVDSQGRLLAINIGTESFFAYPNRETSARVLAAKFAPISGRRSSRLRTQWQKRTDRFTWMARRCDKATAERIRSWNLAGVHPTSEYARVYPCTIAGVRDPIGSVSDALDGTVGIELAYDGYLKGTDGEGVFIADATGRRFALDPVPVKPLQPGARLHLTLDWSWQSILSEELVGAVRKWNARSGMALLMDPYTGGIIAMADYDPAGLRRCAMKNRLVSDLMEPGSTFKLVPFAAALSDGALTLGRYFDGEEGRAQFSGRTLHDDKKHGIMSAREVFVVSSNIGTGRIANELMPGRLDFWARRLGFGKKTGIDLQGEESGWLAKQIHSEFNTATRAIGHGVAVTPIQLAVAYSAVANGGYLVRPHLVESIELSGGGRETIPVIGERVLRPEVACLLKDIMTDVVREGTAKTIWDPRFPIGGKTGTAEKPDPVTKRYDKSKYIASFVGFYPTDKPRMVGLVILDEPQKVHYGGYTAGPVLLNTIRRGAGTENRKPLHVQPYNSFARVSSSDNETDWARRLVDAVAPMIAVGEAHAEGREPAGQAGPQAIGSQPNAPSGCEKVWDVWMNVSEQEMPAVPVSEGRWPDLRGMSLREALAVLRATGARWTIVGSGVVVDQSPAPEAAMARNRVCCLTLQ